MFQRTPIPNYCMYEMKICLIFFYYYEDVMRICAPPQWYIFFLHRFLRIFIYSFLFFCVLIVSIYWCRIVVMWCVVYRVFMSGGMCLRINVNVIVENHLKFMQLFEFITNDGSIGVNGLIKSINTG